MNENRRELVRRKVNELERKYEEYARVCDCRCENRVQYKFFMQTSTFLSVMINLGIAVLLVVIFHKPSLGIGWTIGTLISGFSTIFFSNRKERKLLQANQAADIVICFCTQEVLNEICELITKVERCTERVGREIEERKAKREARDKQRQEERLAEAERLQLPFETLFGIVRTELEGEIQPYEPSDGEVHIKLPQPDERCLNFDWFCFQLTEDGLDKLTFRVSQLRPVMERYHSLQKSLDTAVPAEQ